MIEPTTKQTAFLLVPHKEVLFGGAAGGGKSVGILAAASQYLDVPGYSALILRQTYRDLALAGALMDMAHQWWRGTAAKWRAADYTWLFPSGATLTFGYLEREADKYRYQGSEYQFIGFDELTQFETESRYLYLFSRLRRIKDFTVPLRIRAATNPGGLGHEWVKKRFISHPSDSCVFIPSMLEDNPYLDQEEYDLALSNLDPVTRQQLRAGDWEIDPRGGAFQRHWYKFLDASPSNAEYRVRYWDLASSTAEEFANPDWTVGTRMSITTDGTYFIDDVVRFRATPQENEEIIAETARIDGFDTQIFMEQEPGASGKTVIDHYRRNIVKGYQFRADKEYRTTKKEIRAKPFSAASQDGMISLVLGEWISAWLDEHTIFPDGSHDDQVDSSVGAFTMLGKLVRGGEAHTVGKQRYGKKRRRKE